MPLVPLRRGDRSWGGGGEESVLLDRLVQGVDERIDEVTKTSRLGRV